MSFRKFSGSDTPDPQSGRGDPLPHPTPSPAFGQARGGWDPNLGPPQLFSRGCAPVAVHRQTTRKRIFAPVTFTLTL